MRGSKIRAPVSGKERMCQYSVRRMHGGIELVMECQSCGAGGLNNSECYKGVIRAIQLQGMPTAIILRSHIEKRHDSRSTKVMGQIAEIINLIEDLQNQISVDSHRNDRCSSCLGPLKNELGGMKASFISKNIQNGIQKVQNIDKHEFRTAGVKCDDCAGMINLQTSNISKLTKELEKEILAGTFNIVGVKE